MRDQVRMKAMKRETPRPDFFIVGAAKCGTTSMYEYLRQHPEVFMSARKEPHFFATDLKWQWDWGIVDEAAYRALFADAGDARRIGEGSTWYLYSAVAARRIKAFSPEARIIIMLRDPVEMIRSLHWHSIRNGTEDLYDFSAALDAEEDRRNGLRIPKAAPFADALFYRSVPLYTQQVRRYFEVFGRERVHVIIFDDLATDPAREYDRVVEFLEVGDTFEPEFVVANPGTARTGMPFPRFSKRHRRLHRFVQATTPLLWRRRAGEFLKRFQPLPPPKPTVDPQVRSQLRAYFASEVEDLGRLLDRDLSHWSREE